MKKILAKMDALVVMEIAMMLMAGFWYALVMRGIVPTNKAEWSVELLLSAVVIELARKGFF